MLWNNRSLTDSRGWSFTIWKLPTHMSFIMRGSPVFWCDLLLSLMVSCLMMVFWRDVLLSLMVLWCSLQASSAVVAGLALAAAGFAGKNFLLLALFNKMCILSCYCLSRPGGHDGTSYRDVIDPHAYWLEKRPACVYNSSLVFVLILFHIHELTIYGNHIQYISSTFKTYLFVFFIFSGRYVLQAAKHMEPQMKQALQNIPKSVRNNYMFRLQSKRLKYLM